MPNSHVPTWRDETASDASRRAGRAVWTGVKTDWCGSACVLVRRRSWVAARPEWVGRCRRRSWQSRLLEEPADDWELRARTVAVNTWRHQSSRSPSVYTGCANKSGATDSRTQFCHSWTDLKKFTGRFHGKFVVKWILKIPPHLANVVHYLV